jgi:hypothetical protein
MPPLEIPSAVFHCPAEAHEPLNINLIFQEECKMVQAIKTKATKMYLNFAATSGASKAAKLAVFMFMLLFLTPQQVYAAEFIDGAIDMLGIVIIAIGGGLGIWGIVNLLEGYGNDNPGAKSQGIKQLMAGGGLILIGIFVPDALSGLFA